MTEMIYRIDRKVKEEKAKRIKGVVIALLLTVALMLVIPILAEGIHPLGKKLWSTKYDAVTLVEAIGSIPQKKAALVAENKRIRAQLEELESSKIRIQVLEEQNRELQSVVNRVIEKQESIVAAVLVSPKKSVYRSMVIDQGAKSGISKGDHVVSAGSLIGDIVEVYRSTALVRLYSAPESLVAGRLQETFENVELIGQGGGGYELQILRGIDIEPGDIIVDEGIDEDILAVVEEVEFDPRDPFQKVLARVPINLNLIKFVEVVKSQERQSEYEI